MTKILDIIVTIVNIIWVGVLWILTSIPILTMGAASCAAYDVMANLVRRGDSNVTSAFFDSFKENFLVSLPVQLIITTIIAFLGFNVFFLYGYKTDATRLLANVLLAIIVFFVMIMFYLYPLMQRFDEKRLTLIKMAVYLTFDNFHRIIILTIICSILSFAVYIVPAAIIITVGIWWYITAILLDNSIQALSGKDKEEIKEEENTEEPVVEKKTIVVKRRRLKKIFKRQANESLIEISQSKRNTTVISKEEQPEDRIIKKND